MSRGPADTNRISTWVSCTSLCTCPLITWMSCICFPAYLPVTTHLPATRDMGWGCCRSAFGARWSHGWRNRDPGVPGHGWPGASSVGNTPIPCLVDLQIRTEKVRGCPVLPVFLYFKGKYVDVLYFMRWQRNYMDVLYLLMYLLTTWMSCTYCPVLTVLYLLAPTPSPT